MNRAIIPLLLFVCQIAHAQAALSRGTQYQNQSVNPCAANTSCAYSDISGNLTLRSQNGQTIQCLDPLVETSNAIGTAQTAGMTLTNPTSAGVGAQQFGPALVSCGNGWETGTGSSRATCSYVQNRPVQGVANPSSETVIYGQVNAGVPAELASFSTLGAKLMTLNDASGPEILRVADNAGFTVLYLGTQADNDFILSGNSAGIINFATGGATQMQLHSFAMVPGVDLLQTIGESNNGWRETYSRHYAGRQGAIPSCVTADAGAGIGASCSTIANSKDIAGTIEVITAGAPGATAVIATVSFDSAWVTPPFCTLSDSSATSQALAVTQKPALIQANTLTTSFNLTSGSVALASGATYRWNYTCLQ